MCLGELTEQHLCLILQVDQSESFFSSGREGTSDWVFDDTKKFFINLIISFLIFFSTHAAVLLLKVKGIIISRYLIFEKNKIFPILTEEEQLNVSRVYLTETDISQY